MLTSLVTSSSSARNEGPRARVAPERVREFVEQVVSEDTHALRVLSLTNGVLGVLHSAALGVHAIGRGLAAARSLDVKHAIKQVDRLLSNRGIDVWQWFAHWVSFVVGAREQVAVALDWTHFEPDDQATIALYLITSHGRATPLVWNERDREYGGATDREDRGVRRAACRRPLRAPGRRSYGRRAVRGGGAVRS